MSEAELVKSIRKALSKKYPLSVWYKIHTGPFQERGVPDIVGCLAGRFVALEVKTPSNTKGPTGYQFLQIERIGRAGGVVTVVQSVDEALAAIEKISLSG